MLKKRKAVTLIVALVGTIAFERCLGAETLRIVTDIYSPVVSNTPKDTQQADQFFLQARDACQASDVGTALRLATEAIAADPDHVEARRVLGYRRVGEHWVGNYAARRLERGEVWHSQFGWIRAIDLPRFEAGERPFGRRWITPEEDTRRHAKIENGWQIRTDHFRVTTNHSRLEAARLAARLETLYQIWQQLFGGFSLEPAELLKRFGGKEASGYRSKPFEVIFYRTRDEYNTALRSQQPRIEITLGIYFDTTHKTHFFAGDEQDAGTIYHEAVHQFFQESRPAARNVAASSNAWLTEGVACYFESLVESRDELGHRIFTIGTAKAGRLPAARHRRLVNDYYVPLADLSALGLKDFQQRRDLPRLYSQSAGLATFLMHSKQAVYRPALVEMLQLLYAGRDEVGTLEDLTGHRFEQLDREYREFLEADQAAGADAPVVP